MFESWGLTLLKHARKARFGLAQVRARHVLIKRARTIISAHKRNFFNRRLATTTMPDKTEWKITLLLMFWPQYVSPIWLRYLYNLFFSIRIKFSFLWNSLFCIFFFKQMKLKPQFSSFICQKKMKSRFDECDAKLIWKVRQKLIVKTNRIHLLCARLRQWRV